MYIYMHAYKIQPYKEGNPVICDNIDVPGIHYAKWNKPGIERQILQYLTYMWNLKKSNS